jgi:DNA-binding CsgD family transcriptional regulator
LKKRSALEPVVIAIQIDDPALLERLNALLSDIPGIRLASIGETGDVVLAAARDLPSCVTDSALTPREIEVLSLMADGASNKAIAHRLGISIHTAKFHVGSVLDKLDATGRTDAVTHATRLGVIHL